MRLELNEMVATIIQTVPEAYAYIYGSDTFPEITGSVLFYPIWFGSLIAVDISGLPTSTEKCSTEIFGFHIHEGSRCLGYPDDPFSEVGASYNPTNCDHPSQLGDLPPLVGNKGKALQIFYTDHFTPEGVTGKTLIIHSLLEDFLTPSDGNLNTKIACGEILRNRV